MAACDEGQVERRGRGPCKDIGQRGLKDWSATVLGVCRRMVVASLSSREGRR